MSDETTPSNPAPATPEPVLASDGRSQPNFYVVEGLVYLAQLFTFFLVAVLTSNMLRDEKSLLAYMAGKVNENALTDVIATVIAVAATFGLVAALARSFPKSPLVERVAEEVLAEAPRTAYVFGSAIAGTLFAVSLYLHNRPQPDGLTSAQVLFVGLIWAIIGFLYGLFFSWAFKKNGRKASNSAA